MQNHLSEQEIIRRQYLDELRAMGVDPFPAEAFSVNTHASELRHRFDTEPDAFKEISLAGRLMSKRIMGKASFAELQDSSGRIQLYINRDQICPGENKELYNTVFKRLCDIGDFIGVRGYGFKTQTGEISVHVQEFFFLAKSLHPLPIVKTDAEGNVYDAFTDPEQRYRKRYVDLIVNPHVKEIFVRRSRLINAMRRYFDERGWLEVETPFFRLFTVELQPGLFIHIIMRWTCL